MFEQPKDAVTFFESLSESAQATMSQAVENVLQRTTEKSPLELGCE